MERRIRARTRGRKPPFFIPNLTPAERARRDVLAGSDLRRGISSRKFFPIFLYYIYFYLSTQI